MKAFTDYPFTFLGDVAYQEAPIRSVEVHGWDGDKYARITVEGESASVKAGYLYQQPGRCGEVAVIDKSTLKVLND
ncbi:hypothetical protein [Pseudomonas aeruginosa]|uniref:hypothetical protein n=1 Tax=Pseudomonas aeruginosa TaxID=287 RepID=UPI000A79F2A6|nr:hypothetical protein [Pseudomonas aeruginosa]MBI8355610.1 hypothetical protein [Pseudomonas aeruginosa]MEC6384981.1 hypothetical protein [Pseudomonas aeruginosa]MWW48841.1 hypothetical protein [Pseudomonas aeruginosa]